MGKMRYLPHFLLTVTDMIKIDKYVHEHCKITIESKQQHLLIWLGLILTKNENFEGQHVSFIDFNPNLTKNKVFELQHVRTPTLSVQFKRVNDPESIISFTSKCYKTY